MSTDPMFTDKKPPRRRLRKIVVVSLIVLSSFGVGVVTTAIVAVPVATIGLTFGIIGVGAFGAAQMMTALQSGSSEQRMTALTQLRTALNVSNASQPNPEFTNTMRPAVEACTSDLDRDVVDLANEVLGILDGAVHWIP